MNNFGMLIWKMGAALICLLTLSFAAPVLAQAEPSEPVPQPPPSVEQFSLPPGNSTPAPQPAPTGPVDDTAPPAGVTPTPVQPAPQPSETPDGPETVPATAREISPQDSRPPTPAIQTPRPDRAPDRPRTQPSPEAERVVPQAEVDSETTAPGDPAAEEMTLPAEPTNTPSLAPTNPSSTDADQTSDRSTLYFVIPSAVLFLIGLGYFIWRRRNKAEYLHSDDVVAPLEEPKRGKNVETVEADPVPTPAPSEPIVETKSDVKTSSDGFVTTKIRKTEPAPPPTDSAQAIKAPLSNQLNIDFHAESASSTLMNAVVGYRVVITNNANQPISDLHVSGTMIQADKSLVETAASSQGQLLHEVGSLKAGQDEQVSGDIRLPLAAFKPIDFQSKKLFVPLVLLRFDYIDSDGNPQMQAVNYLVGTEHTPPRGKMAPFRLDLGPRNFGDVAHRVFQS